MKFEFHTEHKPAGDQPKAIEKLIEGLNRGARFQTLLGVTGSGKTFTAANVIKELQKPTLVIAHNKTLAAQLCNEFREFFPKNAVEYFVSYYDYYQPEAYMPASDTYIEKESMVNEEIDRLRHAATEAVLTRRDVIVAASVSCIYGLGEPEVYQQAALHLSLGQIIIRNEILHMLINMQFIRTNDQPTRGQFRLRASTIEIMPQNHEIIYRVEIENNKVAQILVIDPVTRAERETLEKVMVFPAKHFVMRQGERDSAMKRIRDEMDERLKYFKENKKFLEEDRLSRRTRYDLEMIKNVGYCNGIENYSRPMSGRPPGSSPETLLDYFKLAHGNDWLLIIDESHVTIPQVGGMYEGDRARKNTLIEHGFRLPSAADNRPLKFTEFEERIPQTIFMSATPSKYERAHSEQVVEQIIRPTGLVDPKITVLPVTADAEHKSQVDDVIERIRVRVKKQERVMVTTLTKKMAEDLTDYLEGLKIKTKYLHSNVETIDRIGILTDFRKGEFDVLVGVNLLREGLDLPEVTLVAILDADKEGFLRSDTALIQTIGRAARNVSGEVVMYADVMTGSMQRAIGETERRRTIQLAYNKEHNITPVTIKKAIKDITEGLTRRKEQEAAKAALALESGIESGKKLEDLIGDKERQMKKAAKELQFELAGVLRDEIIELRKQLRMAGKKAKK